MREAAGRTWTARPSPGRRAVVGRHRAAPTTLRLPPTERPRAGSRPRTPKKVVPFGHGSVVRRAPRDNWRPLRDGVRLSPGRRHREPATGSPMSENTRRGRTPRRRPPGMARADRTDRRRPGRPPHAPPQLTKAPPVRGRATPPDRQASSTHADTPSGRQNIPVRSPPPADSAVSGSADRRRAPNREGRAPRGRGSPCRRAERDGTRADRPSRPAACGAAPLPTHGPLRPDHKLSPERPVQ